MSNTTPERNVVREAQTVENYDPLAKQKAAAKLSVCATVYHQKSSFIFKFAPAG